MPHHEKGDFIRNNALDEYFRVIFFDNDHWLVLNIKISLIFSEYSCSSQANPDFIKMHVVELSFFVQNELSIFVYQTDSRFGPKISTAAVEQRTSEILIQDDHWGLDSTMAFWSKFLESKNRIFDHNVVQADLDDYGESGRSCHQGIATT